MRRYRLDDDRPNEETSIERLFRFALDQLGVEYESQGHVGRYRPDFILHLGNDRIVVECDGPVHTTARQQVRDRRKDAVYAASGLRCYRFDHHAIRKSAIACVESVLNQERLRHAADPDSADDPSA